MVQEAFQCFNFPRHKVALADVEEQLMKLSLCLPLASI